MAIHNRTNHPKTIYWVWIYGGLGDKTDLNGSAHSQFFDVLYRTGFVGFTIYLFVLAVAGLVLNRVDMALFFVLTPCVLFGLFHESFKESHGAFILAMLLWVSSNYYKDKKRVGAKIKHEIS